MYLKLELLVRIYIHQRSFKTQITTLSRMCNSLHSLILDPFDYNFKPTFFRKVQRLNIKEQKMHELDKLLSERFSSNIK